MDNQKIVDVFFHELHHLFLFFNYFNNIQFGLYTSIFFQ